MKKWVQNQARTNQLCEPAQPNMEFQAARSSMATLDRSQTPTDAYDRTRMVQYTLHRAYCTDIVGTSEQTTYRDTGCVYFDWLSATYQNYSSGFTSLSTITLPDFKGGNLFCEWAGNSFIWGFCSQTVNNRHPANDKSVNLRIVVNGVTLVQNYGNAFNHSGFRIFGANFYPPGDLQVELQYQYSSAGMDDVIVNKFDSANMMQGHSWGNKFLALGRWR